MILYCAENATQVALDGIQCLGKCQKPEVNLKIKATDVILLVKENLNVALHSA